MKLPAALVLLILSACQLPFGEREEVLAGVNADRILAAAREVVTSEGYTIEKTAPADKTFTSEWKSELDIVYRGGARRRVVIGTEAGEGGTKLTVKVIKETNDTMTYSLDPEKARWVSAGRDEDAENKIALRTKMKLDLLALKWQD